MTRALVFDLGKVLIPFDWQRGYDAFAAAGAYPAQEVRLRIKELGVFDGLERGLMEPCEVAKRVSSALGLNATFEQFQEMWSSIFLPEAIVPDSMLAGLHENYRLLLLSNTDWIHFNWIRARYPIMRHFDDFLLSYELGVRKPEPAIYQETIKRAGVRPEEAFFTDDRPENIEGALQTGMDAVQFESIEKLQRDLAARGVRW